MWSERARAICLSAIQFWTCLENPGKHMGMLTRIVITVGIKLIPEALGRKALASDCGSLKNAVCPNSHLHPNRKQFSRTGITRTLESLLGRELARVPCS